MLAPTHGYVAGAVRSTGQKINPAWSPARKEIGQPVVRGVSDTSRVSEREQASQSQGSASASSSEEVKSRRTRPGSRWMWLLVVIVALAVAAGYGITQVGLDSDSTPQPTIPADSDGDGLPDEIEQAGWLTQDGSEYRTDPSKADTDDDGLTDGDEAGAPVTNADSENVYADYSNPLLPDTDGDSLGDADEADLDLDPFDHDSDKDGIEDGREVDVVGSAPDSRDTDGDGFEDAYEVANRESKGLDPLLVDVKVSKSTYSTDYAKGAVAGDLWREDSLAWLAGNLTSGASSSIPVIGLFVGALADVRDAIGSAIQGDWVGSGFSAVGAVPGGDVVAIPGKTAKFVARSPELAAAATALIATATKVPQAFRVKAAKRINKNWDDLIDAGASEKSLLQLGKGRTNLNKLAAALKRPNHIKGPPTKFFANGPDGEKSLANIYGAKTKGVDTQVRMSTKNCVDGCNSFVRIIDAFRDGVAHEAKVGYVSLTKFTERQIRKDAWLVKNGDIEAAHWHFFASAYSNKVGPSKAVLDLLDELGIAYTIHLPKAL